MKTSTTPTSACSWAAARATGLLDGRTCPWIGCTCTTWPRTRSYSQLASGAADVPLPRSSFCAVATRGEEEEESYETTRRASPSPTSHQRRQPLECPTPPTPPTIPVAAIADGVAGGGVLLAICALAFILRRSRRGQGKPDGAKAQHKMDTSSGASDNEHNPEKPILDSARSVRLLMTAAPDGTGLVPGELHGGSVPIELQGVDAR
ncbi:hypothetical protein MCOR27_002481 [Pyricularia oryzae]|nr:hypothetical protein MCOR27_002481 [Pyricularia oryzae]